MSQRELFSLLREAQYLLGFPADKVNLLELNDWGKRASKVIDSEVIQYPCGCTPCDAHASYLPEVVGGAQRDGFCLLCGAPVKVVNP
jgi:hypothetical protein